MKIHLQYKFDYLCMMINKMYRGPTSVDGLIAKIGPVSNDIYYGISIVTSRTYEHIIMRYTPSGSLVFSVKYPGEILINSLWLYGSSENFIMYVTKAK